MYVCIDESGRCGGPTWCRNPLQVAAVTSGDPVPLVAAGGPRVTHTFYTTLKDFGYLRLDTGDKA